MNLVTKLFTFSATALITACGNKGNNQQAQQMANAPIPVTTVQVTAIKGGYHDLYPATLVPLNQTDIRPQVTGYITGIYFKDGDYVSKGQRLYSIDQQMYKASYDQAVANIELQETNLEKARKDAQRYHELDKRNAIAKQQVDYADAALAAAEKQVAAARANANTVKANVNFATIYAPFSGTIGISQARIGTSVVAGQSVLNTISSNNPMAVDIAIDQSQLYRFSQLVKSTKTNDSTFTLAFGPDIYPKSGKLLTIDRAVDPQTGTIKIRLTFDNSEGVLRPGMNATVRVLNSLGTQSVIIPHKAVTEQLGEFFVYVVEAQNKVTQRKVKLGTEVGENVVISEGLQSGETIVVEGVQNLREGATITTDTSSVKTAQKK